MDSKILSYLKSTGKNGKYMRDVFSFYTTGKMQSILLKQHITKLEFFPSIRKDEGSLQINFQYYNLCVILEFDETGYEYSIYTQNCSADDLEKGIVARSYSTDFSIEEFLGTFTCLLKSDVRLIKTSKTIEKKKLYKIISSICFAFSFLIIAVPSMYVLISRNTIQAGPWFLVAMLVPFVVSQI